MLVNYNTAFKLASVCTANDDLLVCLPIAQPGHNAMQSMQAANTNALHHCNCLHCSLSMAPSVPVCPAASVYESCNLDVGLVV